MKSNIRGFTLPEILVAIVLFAVLAVVSGGLLVQNFGLNKVSENSVEATVEVQDTLERARTIVIAKYENPSAFISELNSAGLSNVVCENVDVFGNVMQGQNKSCDKIGDPPARRLTITAATDAVSVQGKNLTQSGQVVSSIDVVKK